MTIAAQKPRPVLLIGQSRIPVPVEVISEMVQVRDGQVRSLGVGPRPMNRGKHAMGVPPQGK